MIAGQMHLPHFHGRRDGGPDHIRAIIDQMEMDREDAAMAKELEDAEQRVWEAREEEDARAYLKQQPCYDDKDYR